MIWWLKQVVTIFGNREEQDVTMVHNGTTFFLIMAYAYAKVLTTTQTSILISVQPRRSTRSSDIITLSRPPFSSLWRSTTALSVTHHPVPTSQWTSPAWWSRRLIIIIWSHTCQFVFSCITTVTIHYSFSLPLQTQNSILIFSTIHKSFPP